MSKPCVAPKICLFLSLRDAILLSHAYRTLREHLKQSRPMVRARVGELHLLTAIGIQQLGCFNVGGALTLKSQDDLGQVSLLTSLESAVFDDDFNEDLGTMVLPDSLQTLTFGRAFNQSFDTVSLPCGLRSLTFGQGFTQSLKDVVLPRNLQGLTLGSQSAATLIDVTLPKGLPKLTILDEVDDETEFQRTYRVCNELISYATKARMERKTRMERPCPLCGGAGTALVFQQG